MLGLVAHVGILLEVEEPAAGRNRGDVALGTHRHAVADTRLEVIGSTEFVRVVAEDGGRGQVDAVGEEVLRVDATAKDLSELPGAGRDLDTVRQYAVVRQAGMRRHAGTAEAVQLDREHLRKIGVEPGVRRVKEVVGVMADVALAIGISTVLCAVAGGVHGGVVAMGSGHHRHARPQLPDRKRAFVEREAVVDGMRYLEDEAGTDARPVVEHEGAHPGESRIVGNEALAKNVKRLAGSDIEELDDLVAERVGGRESRVPLTGDRQRQQRRPRVATGEIGGDEIRGVLIGKRRDATVGERRRTDLREPTREVIGDAKRAQAVHRRHDVAGVAEGGVLPCDGLPLSGAVGGGDIEHAVRAAPTDRAPSPSGHRREGGEVDRCRIVRRIVTDRLPAVPRSTARSEPVVEHRPRHGRKVFVRIRGYGNRRIAPRDKIDRNVRRVRQQQFVALGTEEAAGPERRLDAQAEVGDPPARGARAVDQVDDGELAGPERRKRKFGRCECEVPGNAGHRIVVHVRQHPAGEIDGARAAVEDLDDVAARGRRRDVRDDLRQQHVGVYRRRR